MAELSIHDATHTERTVVLPCGMTVRLRKLRLTDYSACVTIFGHMLEPMAVQFQRDPTEAEVREHIPTVWAEMLAVPVAGQLLEMFLQFFAPELALAAIEERFDLGDLEALWAALLEDNRIPFERRRLEMVATGAFQQAQTDWETLKPAAQSVEFSDFLSGLGWIREITLSPPNTPSASPTSKRPSSGGKRRSRDTSPE